MNTLRSFYGRQPVLTVYGLLLLVAGALTYALQFVDARLFDGIEVWVKPTKFYVSVAVYALTAAWFFGYVRPERRRTVAIRYVVWIIVACGTFETGWITWQAAHAAASHFNQTSLFPIIMYALMGLGAILMVSTALPLAWEIFRRPAEGLRPDYAFAVIAGLLLTCVLGGGLGGYMSAQPGHSVGPVGGHFPIFGWNRLGGDLRVAHFFGMHLEQALPILAAIVAPLPRPVRWPVVVVGAVASVGLTVFVFLQAVAGQPFLAGLG